MLGDGWEFRERDLTIAGDLMFSTVLQDEELCRGLIETVLSRKIESIAMVGSQQQMRVSLQSRAGIVDVIARDSDGNVFDVEMQNERKLGLVRRVRYYGSLIDVGMLDRGEDYPELRDRVIIFICSMDPFGDGLKRYTCAMTCRENGKEVGDGQLSVYVNVQGLRGESTPELDALIAYIGDADKIEGEYVRRLDDAVRAVRDDPVWRGKLMLWEIKYQWDLADAKREAAAEVAAAATAEGLAQGIAQGLTEGLNQGRAEGRSQQIDELSQLADALEARGRSSELLRALRDPAFREQLMTEFGIGE